MPETASVYRLTAVSAWLKSLKMLLSDEIHFFLMRNGAGPCQRGSIDLPPVYLRACGRIPEFSEVRLCDKAKPGWEVSWGKFPES